MERFLRYSLEKGRTIRLMYLEEGGGIRQVSGVVTALTPEMVDVCALRPKQALTLRRDQLLSADYRKGDEGQD